MASYSIVIKGRTTIESREQIAAKKMLLVNIYIRSAELAVSIQSYSAFLLRDIQTGNRIASDFYYITHMDEITPITQRIDLRAVSGMLQ
jgi:hypothetical protein